MRQRGQRRIAKTYESVHRIHRPPGRENKTGFLSPVGCDLDRPPAPADGRQDIRKNNADRSEPSFTLPKLPRSIPPRTARLAYAERTISTMNTCGPQSTLNTTAPAIIANAICKRPIVMRESALPSTTAVRDTGDDASRLRMPRVRSW